MLSDLYETRREWLRKDTRIFGLYESEAFNQSLTVKWDGVAIADGSIKEENKKKMNWLERVLLFASLGLSVWALCSSPSRPSARSVDHRTSAAVSNRLSVVRERVAATTNVPPLVVRDSFRFVPATSNMASYVIFGDRFIRLGIPCEYGYPSLIASDHDTGTCFDGSREFHLVPNERRFQSNVNPVIIRLCE